MDTALTRHSRMAPGATSRLHPRSHERRQQHRVEHIADHLQRAAQHAGQAAGDDALADRIELALRPLDIVDDG
ncbi:hypothetical protein [Achromobacter sp. DMS1]|uniref:hypothetical protein n=1 Tax=Achromobacter sp. DMS1 TaxID=1688405 RepID=UPI001F3EEDBA|nr:hypothetical protein [Achromobacter sp. DMS1]